jgi:predicted nucleic acid-binding protein
MPQTLVDTDVLIDYFRGVTKAVKYLESLSSPPALSAITVGELYAGVRDGTEQRSLDAFIDVVQIVPLDADSSRLGGLFRRDFGPSHGVTLTGALIAASAHLHNFELVTLNRKHYPMLERVMVPYRKA